MDPLVPSSQVLTSVNDGDTTKIYIYLLIIFICIIFSAFFSATETAMTCANRVRLKVKAENGSKSSKLALKLIDMYDRSLIALLIGNNIVNTLGSSIATVVAILLVANRGLATTLATVIMTVLVFLFGEVFPKNFAKQNPERFLQVFSYPMIVLYILFYPFTLVFNFLLWIVKKLFKVDSDQNTLTEDEFQGIIEIVEEEGVLDEEESDIIQAAVDFGDITVKDVLTKVDDIISVDVKKMSRKELMAYLNKSEYSRIPVYEDNVNNIVGVLHVRKFLKNAMKSRNFSVRTSISNPFFVKDDTKLDDMVEIFKKEKKHMAFVKNSENNIIGLVTMEDVIEELIGEEKITPKKGGNN